MFIYILYNEAYGPQKYKIGSTHDLDNNIEKHNKYYLTESYYCHSIKTNDKKTKLIIFTILKRYQIENREIFHCHIDEIKNAFKIAKDISDELDNRNLSKSTQKTVWY